MDEERKSGKKVIPLLASIAVHSCFLWSVCYLSTKVEIKPAPVMQVSLMQPQLPKPEPPKPEPPKPEPPAPKPEPPKPEPPKPKPEPPKPKPEPPKPKPEPPKPKPEPPKPKPEPPKPKPDPPKTRQQSIAERLNNSPRVEPQKNNTKANSAKLEERLRALTRNTEQPTQTSQSAAAARITEVQTNDYARKVVGPYIFRIWIPPASGELDVAPGRITSPVISITVLSSGRVSSRKIVKPSNSRVLNANLEALLPRITQMPEPPSAYIRGSSYVTIEIDMTPEY